MGGVRSAARAARAYPPLNRVLTAAARPLIRGSSRLSSGVVRHLPRVGRSSAVLPNGRRLVLVGDDPWTSSLFWRGWAEFYEPEVLPLFYGLARAARTTVDVGASVGIYALVAAHANPVGRVIAFEPSAAVERLRRNITTNGLDNVLAVPLAAGAHDGTATMSAATGNVGPVSLEALASARLQDETVPHDGVHEWQVTVTTVDAFLEERGIGDVDLVKIDTERSEPAVVEGMLSTIERYRPSIVCEVLGREEGRTLEELLRPFGYHWYHLTWMGPLERDEIVPSPTPVCQNYLFTGLTTGELLDLLEDVRAGIR